MLFKIAFDFFPVNLLEAKQEMEIRHFLQCALRIVFHGLNLHRREMLCTRNSKRNTLHYRQEPDRCKQPAAGFAADINEVEPAHERVGMQVVRVAGRQMKCLITQGFKIRDKRCLRGSIGYEVKIGCCPAQSICVKAECANDCKGETLLPEERRDLTDRSRKVQLALPCPGIAATGIRLQHTTEKSGRSTTLER